MVTASTIITQKQLVQTIVFFTKSKTSLIFFPQSETEDLQVAASHMNDENLDNGAILSTKGSVINVRGGGEQKLGDSNSPATGSSGSRGIRSSRPVRSMCFTYVVNLI